MSFIKANSFYKWLKGFLSLEEPEFDFSKKIKVDLFETEVSGLSYYHFAKGLGLSVGSYLYLRREPSNQFDGNAIEVYTQKNIKLGYLPKLENHIPTLIADQGVELVAEIIDFSFEPKKLLVKIYQLL